jgi:adenine-specific DNA-methyltransferase
MFSAPKTDLLFAYLLTEISKDIFNDNRREYGNGLQKFEPNDINKALMVDLYRISKKDEEEILNLYHEYRKTALEKKPKESLLSDINSKFVDIFKA